MIVATVALENSSNLKNHLKNQGFYDCNYLCKKISDSQIAIPIKQDFLLSCLNSYSGKNNEFKWENIKFKLENGISLLRNRKKAKSSPLIKLKNNLRNDELFNKMLEHMPHSFEKFQDLLLFPDHSLESPIWQDQGNLQLLAQAHDCTRIAVKQVVKNDAFRSPRVHMLLGSDSVVTRIENGIKYHFDIQKCMFSQGNITEKIRIAGMNCHDETIVDLYAGIGYFSLNYLVHSKCRLLYACEWNPASVEALKRNLMLNAVHQRCIVLQGDCAQVCPVNVADRVNLGLLPSSEGGWLTACKALKKDKGGVLHIHGNVDVDDDGETGADDDDCDGNGGFNYGKKGDDDGLKRDDDDDENRGGSDDNDGDGKTVYEKKKRQRVVYKCSLGGGGGQEVTCNRPPKGAWKRWAWRVEGSIKEMMEALLVVDRSAGGEGSGGGVGERSCDGNSHNNNNNTSSGNIDNTSNQNNICYDTKNNEKEKRKKRRVEVRVRHIERVKAYGPRVDHVVLDVHVLVQAGSDGNVYRGGD